MNQEERAMRQLIEIVRNRVEEEEKHKFSHIRIENDSGGVLGTKIIDERTGDDLAKVFPVCSVKMKIGNVNNVIRAEIEIGLVHLRTRCGKVTWETRNPLTGDIEALSGMTFADGSAVEFTKEGDVEFYKDGKLVTLQPISDGRMYKFNAAPDSIVPSDKGKEENHE